MTKTYRFEEITRPDSVTWGVQPSAYLPVEAESAEAAIGKLALGVEAVGAVKSLNPDSAYVRLANGRELWAELAEEQEGEASHA